MIDNFLTLIQTAIRTTVYGLTTTLIYSLALYVIHYKTTKWLWRQFITNVLLTEYNNKSTE